MTPKVYVGTAGMSVWFSPDGGERWERPYSESGLYLESRVWGLTAHPGEPDAVYAGTDIGLYRWSEQARKWTHLPGPLDKLETWALVQEASDPAVMWAGTRPAGLFKTTDAGRTWQQLAVPFVDTCIFVVHPRVTSILLDPAEPGTAWVGVELDGVRRTRDGGRTWQPCNEGMFTADIHGLSLTRHGARKLFATTNKGLFVSEDDGDSWTHHPVDSPWQYMRVSHERADRTGTMFISNGDGPPGSTGRILRSRDNGKSWENTGAEGFNSTPWCFATNPADPDRLYCASNLGQLYRSTDGGEHWTKLKREMGEIRSIMWRPAS
jgi:photosystem II stability/assembly factor-like uncharacterized protein